MHYGEFIKLVGKMRKAQKIYFRNPRQPDLLAAAMELEKQVDRVIERNPMQKTLPLEDLQHTRWKLGE